MNPPVLEYCDEAGRRRGLTKEVYDLTRTWVLNDIGTATAAYPATTPDLAIILDPYGIYKFHQDHAPSWVGTIATIDWENGNAIVGYKAIEGLLQKKPIGMKTPQFETSTLGAIASTVFAQVRASCRIEAIQAGQMDASRPHFGRWPLEDFYETLMELAEKDGAAMWVDAQLRLHVRDRRGGDKRTDDNALVEQKTCGRVKVREDYSDVLTHIIGLSSGSDLSKQFISMHHLRGWRGPVRGETQTFSEIKDLASLHAPTQAVLRGRAYPRITLDTTISDPVWALGRFFLDDYVRVVTHARGKAETFDARVLGVELPQGDEARYIFDVIHTEPPLEALAPSWN